jgi:hypothetical protein
VTILYCILCLIIGLVAGIAIGGNRVAAQCRYRLLVTCIESWWYHDEPMLNFAALKLANCVMLGETPNESYATLRQLLGRCGSGMPIRDMILITRDEGTQHADDIPAHPFKFAHDSADRLVHDI